MAGPDERYLFDDEALERALAGGTEENHKCIEACVAGSLCLTKTSKENFLKAFAEEKSKLESFEIIRRQVKDNLIAASFTDQLQNYQDIETDQVQDKIFLLATAYRENLIVVTGENVSPTTRVRVLAEQVGVECINVDEFFEAMAK